MKAEDVSTKMPVKNFFRALIFKGESDNILLAYFIIFLFILDRSIFSYAFYLTMCFKDYAAATTVLVSDLGLTLALGWIVYKINTK